MWSDLILLLIFSYITRKKNYMGRLYSPLWKCINVGKKLFFKILLVLKGGVCWQSEISIYVTKNKLPSNSFNPLWLEIEFPFMFFSAGVFSLIFLDLREVPWPYPSHPSPLLWLKKHLLNWNIGNKFIILILRVKFLYQICILHNLHIIYEKLNLHCTVFNNTICINF